MKIQTKFGTIRRHPKKSNGYYECSKCGENFDAEYKMWDHEQKHVDEERISTPTQSPTPSPLLNRLKRSASRSPSPQSKKRCESLRNVHISDANVYQSERKEFDNAGTPSKFSNLRTESHVLGTPVAASKHRPRLNSPSTLEAKTPGRRSLPQEDSDLPSFRSPGQFLKGRDGSSLLPSLFQTPDKSQQLMSGTLSPSLSQIKTPTLFKVNKDTKATSPLSPLVNNNQYHGEYNSPLAIPLQKTPKRVGITQSFPAGSKTPNRRSNERQQINMNTPTSSAAEADNRRLSSLKSNMAPTQLSFMSPNGKEHSPRFMGQHIRTSMFPGNSPSGMDTENNTITHEQSFSNEAQFSSDQSKVNFDHQNIIYPTNVSQKYIDQTITTPSKSEFNQKLISKSNQPKSEEFLIPRLIPLPVRTQAVATGGKNHESIRDDASSIWDEEHFDDSDDEDGTGNSKRLATNKLVNPKKLDGVDNIHTCKYCGKSFTYRELLKRHVRKHTNSKPYECDQCGKTFRLYDNMIRHFRVHTGEKPYECGQCDRRFRDLSNLRQHRESHAKTNDFICDTCGRAYKNKRLLSIHVCNPIKNKGKGQRLSDKYGIDPSEQYDPTDGNNTPKNKGTVYCRICYHRFKNARLLEDHLINDHHLKPDEKKRQKVKPLPVDFQGKVYKCPICQKILGSIAGLKLHAIRIHNYDVDELLADKTIKKAKFNFLSEQEKTSQELTNASHLDLQNTDNNSRNNFNINIYGKSQKSQLIHQDNELHECVICSAVYASAETLRTHIIEKHSFAPKIDDKQNKVIQNSYKCSYCPKTVSSTSGLKAHISRIHKTLVVNDNPLKKRSDNKMPIPEQQTQNKSVGINDFQIEYTADGCLQCPVCPRELKSVTGWKSHIAQKHREYNSTMYSKHIKSTTSVPASVASSNAPNHCTVGQYSGQSNVTFQPILQEPAQQRYISENNHQNKIQNTAFNNFQSLPQWNNRPVCEDNESNHDYGQYSENLIAYTDQDCNQNHVKQIQHVQSEFNHYEPENRVQEISVSNLNYPQQLNLHNPNNTNFNQPMTKQELLQKMMQDESMLEKMTSFYNNIVKSDSSKVDYGTEENYQQFHDNIDTDEQYGDQQLPNDDDEALDLSQKRKRVTFADQQDGTETLQPLHMRRQVKEYADDEYQSENSEEDIEDETEEDFENDTQTVNEDGQVTNERTMTEEVQNNPTLFHHCSIPEEGPEEFNNPDQSNITGVNFDPNNYSRTITGFNSDQQNRAESPEHVLKAEPHIVSVHAHCSDGKEKANLTDMPSQVLKEYLLQQRGYYLCQCGCMFKDRLLLALHRRMHYFDDILQCSFCEDKFESLMELFRHFLSHEK